MAVFALKERAPQGPLPCFLEWASRNGKVRVDSNLSIWRIYNEVKWRQNHYILYYIIPIYAGNVFASIQIMKWYDNFTINLKE